MSIFDILGNPLVDAGLGLIPGIGPALAVGAKTIGTLGGGGQPTSQPAALGLGSAIPQSAFDTSGGKIPATASAPAESETGPGSGNGFLGDVGHFLTSNNGKTALGIAQGINAALEQKKANDYAKQALGSIEASYNQRAPLRAQGLQMLQQAQLGNPYAGAYPGGTP